MSLERVCDHIHRIQEVLKRRLLLENPATYVQFVSSTMSEPQFLSEIVRRTGCGLLLDLTNVHVSCTNHDWDPAHYLDGLPLAAVAQVHLAGFVPEVDDTGSTLLIDSHSAPVDSRVWAMYGDVISRCGPVPTLIEWDNDVPELDVLLNEARLAEERLRAGGASPILSGGGL